MKRRILVFISATTLFFFNFSSGAEAEEETVLDNEELLEEQSLLEESLPEPESIELDEEEVFTEQEEPVNEIDVQETTEESEELNEEMNKETDEDSSEESEELNEETNKEKVEEADEKNLEELEEEELESTIATLSLIEPYSPGDSGDHVVALKEKLVLLGFASWSSPSQYYGDITANVVRGFQAYYHLSQTGIADHTTRAKIDEVLHPPYKIGDRGVPIVELKKDLVSLGYANWSNPSQFYGENTANRVKAFQDDYGISADGIAGTETINKMKEVLRTGKLYRSGDSGEHIVEMKKDLVRLGFASWNNPTQFYGSNTAEVVQSFQEYYHLPRTGIADATTRNKMAQVLNPPYKNRDRGEPVVKLKEHLVKLGFANWSNPSQFYGANTANVVKDFQNAYGLTADGIVGQHTLTKMEELINSGISYGDGDSGQHIVVLKKDLVKLGFASWSNPTRFYGSVTSRVVRDFQNYYGLTVTGIANEATRNKMAEVLNPPYINGDRGEPVVKLKEDLVRLGFASWSNPSQFYGTVTANVVTDFQEYYGLQVNGVASDAVLSKIADILSNAYQDGDRGPHIKKIKEGLTLLGFANWSNPTSSYGPMTASVVSEFQRSNHLRVSGMVDEVTLDRLESEVGKKLEAMQVSEYDMTLAEALSKQMDAAPQTDHRPGYVSSQHVEVTGVLAGSSHVRVSPTTKSHSIIQLTAGTRVTLLDRVSGEDLWAGDAWYKISYNGSERYIYANLVTDVTAQVDRGVQLRVRKSPNTSSLTYAVLPENTVVSVASFERNGWLRVSYDWIDAHRDNVIRYLNPARNDAYQHLDLSSNLGLSASQLNEFLNTRIGNRSNSVLRGQGNTFRQAAALPGQTVNELYLISHAVLETAYGTSNLATGKIEVGELARNKWVVFLPTNNGNIKTYTAELVGSNWRINEEKNFNRSSASNIRPTYNTFGVQAVDSDPEIRGSIHAYRQGWDSVEKAIMGGARFIAGDYIHNQYNQNTLYKMRWNPAGMESHGYATKQYATDIRWAVKQLDNIKNMLTEVNLLDSPLLRFNFIQYK